MKRIYLLLFTAVISTGLFSCIKNTPISPTQIAKVDTSKTLISDIALVGNWNILTDTISFEGIFTKYKGLATDHYNFTKYGNLFINEGLDSFVDTAIYAVSSIKQQVEWLIPIIA